MDVGRERGGYAIFLPTLPEGIYRRSLRFVLFLPHATTGNAVTRHANSFHGLCRSLIRTAWTRFESRSSSETIPIRTKVSLDTIAKKEGTGGRSLLLRAGPAYPTH